jgi:hypothetical protein
VLKAYADTQVGWWGTFAIARIYDNLQITYESATPAMAYLKASFVADLDAFGGESNTSASASLSVTGHRLGYQTGDTFGTLVAGMPCSPLAQPGSFCAEGRSIARQVVHAFPVEPGTHFYAASFILSAGANAGAIADASNTAYAWLELPGGATYRPETAGFLTQATPVPEPASIAMILSGLFAWPLLGRRALRRRTKASHHHVSCGASFDRNNLEVAASTQR